MNKKDKKMEKIELTKEELMAIKDEVKFRENVSLRLKIIEKKLSDLNSINLFKGWTKANTWAIGLLYSLIGVLLFLIMKGK